MQLNMMEKRALEAVVGAVQKDVEVKRKKVKESFLQT